MLPPRILTHRKYWIPALLIGLLLVLSYKPLFSYLQINFTINNLVYLLVPLIIYIRQPDVYSYRYGVAGLIFGVLYGFSGTVFYLFLAIGCCAFFILETTLGKLNNLAPLVLLLLTPLVKYFFDVFGFPVRLGLTQLASHILGLFSFDFSANGNMITHNQSVYAVDAACMGLKMVITSLLTGFLWMTYFERKHKKSFSLAGIGTLLALTGLLVILNNLVRIMLLVVTDSPPGSFAHEAIGIVCLLVWVIIPQYWTIRQAGRFFRETVSPSPGKRPVMAYAGLLVGAVGIMGLTFREVPDLPFDKALAGIRWPGYTTKVLASNVVEVRSPYTLIYIKPKRNFYNSHHAPFMCWRGSGYHITNERIETVNNREICLATLSKGQERLHTAWFYDNGDHKTIRQLDWRWRSLKGEEGFRLVNITSENEQVLLEEIDRFMYNRVFSAL